MKHILLIISISLISACQTKQPPDYTNFLESKPASILVLPPLNDSVEVSAPSTCLSIFSEPIAEKGYYVFPVSLVHEFFKENGLTVAKDIHNIPVQKLHEVFGADSVMYIRIKNWGQSYNVISSTAIVQAHVQLVDAKSGLELWSGDLQKVQGSDSAGAGLLGAVISAMVTQAIASDGLICRDLARSGSAGLFFSKTHGLIDGPRVDPPEGS